MLDLIETRQQTPPTHDFFHQWTLPDGTQWASFHRLKNKYLIRFPDLADFIVSKDGLSVSAYPVPGVSNQTIEHLHLNLVMPLALSCQFKLILHGSAIELDNFAVAFLAKSGHGKSTLAASFSTNGHRFLTDDSLILDKVNSQYFVQPAHPSVRLWDDSKRAIIPNTTCSAPLIDYSSKERFLADKQVAFCNETRPLQLIYFLEQSNTDMISITTVSGCDVIIELQKHSFIIDMEEREMMTQHFRNISELATHPIFFRLEYPHSYGSLPDVRESIVNHAYNNILRN